MLQRRLLLVLGSVIMLLLVAAVAAILLLHDVLRDLASVAGATEPAATVEGQPTLEDMVVKFRWTALGVGIVFLLLINGSIIVLLRSAAMILDPINKLVEAGRHLAHEEFDYRVKLQRNDEFGELAQAYNGLAEQLQLNEKRRLETLHQVVRTLSHELNNAISIIELQLRLLARKSDRDGQQAERLRQAHHALQRMTNTVAELARVRRIVLTDYTSGVKMLDLKRSVEEGPPEDEPADRPAVERSPR